jgi:rhomboid protease GluP
MIIECPHCRITVRPDEDGICPACRKPLVSAEHSAGPGGTPVELSAPRRGLAGILAGVVVCLILAAVSVAGQGNVGVYGLLVFFGLILAIQIRVFLFPARLGLRGGWLEIRGLGAFRVPAKDVVDVRLVNRFPILRLARCDAVEPRRHREALARSAATRGFHFALPKGSFTSEQIGRLRQALGWTAQDDEPEAPDQVFESLLQTMTPHLIVTPLLVLINVVIFALLWQVEGREPRGETMIAWGANFAPLTVSGQWWRLFSSMFLHFSVIHVGFNMWILWDIGRIVERMLGNTAFLIAYVTSGFFGSVVSVLWRQDAISAGASGAVFGVFGILLGFMLLRRDSIPIEVIRAHRNSVGAFLVLNLLLGLSISWIDMAAHGGGLLAGFLCGLLLTHKLTPDQRGEAVKKLGQAPRDQNAPSVSFDARSEPVPFCHRLGSRRLRTCLLALVALAACSTTVWYLPAAVQAVRGGKPFPLDTNSVVQRFSAVEVPAIEQFNRLAQDLQSGSVTDEQAADTLEQQLLPPWREATGQVRDSIARVATPHQAMLRQLVEYADQRAKSWELMAEGLRTGDPETIEKSQQASRQADELVQKLQ